MKKLKSLEGITKDQIKEMELKELKKLLQAVVEEQQLEAFRREILNQLDVEEAVEENRPNIIDTTFIN